MSWGMKRRSIRIILLILICRQKRDHHQIAIESFLIRWKLQLPKVVIAYIGYRWLHTIIFTNKWMITRPDWLEYKCGERACFLASDSFSTTSTVIEHLGRHQNLQQEIWWRSPLIALFRKIQKCLLPSLEETIVDWQIYYLLRQRGSLLRQQRDSLLNKTWKFLVGGFSSNVKVQ